MSSHQLFDRAAVRLQRTRHAADIDEHDFLIEQAAMRLAERVGDVRRCFGVSLDLGAHTGQLARQLPPGRIETLVQADLAFAMMQRAPGLRVVADEEALPFRSGSLDLVMSCFSLHWVNDLPGALVQIRHALKPDGLFLGVMPGGATLHELRESLMRAELEIEGGAAPRISPFVTAEDASSLMQRAGFALPLVDVETMHVAYKDPLRLLADLRNMGEANSLLERRRAPLSRRCLERAFWIYRNLFGDDQGRLPATFELLMLTGWKPDETQPRPLRRGSGQMSLAETLGLSSDPASAGES